MQRAQIVGVEQRETATELEYGTMYSVVVLQQGDRPTDEELRERLFAGDIVPKRQYWGLEEAKAYATGWNDNELDRS